MNTRSTTWRREGAYDSTRRIHIKNQLGEVIADLGNVSIPQHAEADADFIALACNAHAGLVDELSKAGEIILAMLDAMTPAQKMKVGATLEASGVSPDGMTRYHERRAVLAKARHSTTEEAAQ